MAPVKKAKITAEILHLSNHIASGKFDTAFIRYHADLLAKELEVIQTDTEPTVKAPAWQPVSEDDLRKRKR